MNVKFNVNLLPEHCSYSIIFFILEQKCWISNSFLKKKSNWYISISFYLPLVMMVRRLFSVWLSDLWSSSRALSICSIFSRLSDVLLAEFIFALSLCLFELTIADISFSDLRTLLSSIAAWSSISGSSITEPRLSWFSKLAASIFFSPSESIGTESGFSVRLWPLDAASISSRKCGLLMALSKLPEGPTGTVISCPPKYVVISWISGPLVQGSVGFLSPFG